MAVSTDVHLFVFAPIAHNSWHHEGFQQNLRDQEAKVVTPVVGLSARMDQLSTDMRTVSQAVADLTSMMSKLQGQLNDLNNAVKVMQAPPVQPPPTGAPGTTAGSSPGGGCEGFNQTDLYNNATRDRMGGKLDLAVQEYNDYLKCFGNTDMAPNAQYYIASIHSSQGDYDNAVREFDIVLEKYGDNNKTADAMYGKGQALVKMGRRTDGARQFQELIRKFPKNDLSTKACDQLKGMGLSCGLRAAAPSKTASKRKR